MKSLKVKKIVLKDSNLRKGLRQVLKLAVDDKLDYYTHLEKLYTLKRNQHGKLTLSQLKRKRELSRLKIKIYSDLKKSICQCSIPVCLSDGRVRSSKRSTDLDMVWVPWMKAWYCVPCFEAHFKDMTIDDFIEGFGELRVFQPQLVKAKAQKYKHSFLNKVSNTNYRPEIDEYKQ